jgi:hypothetical protein
MAGFVGSSSTQTLGTGAGTGGTGLTVTKTGCTAGNLLVVRFCIWRSTNTDPGTVTASGWTTGPQQAETASARHRVGWLFLANCGSGSQSAVLAWSGAGDCTAIIDEYSGMGAATLSGTAGNSGANSPFNTGNATSSATGGLAIAVIGDDGSNTTYTISDGKNSRGGRNPSADLPALLGSDLLTTVSTTNSGAWTSSPTNVAGNAAFAVGVLLPGPTGGAVVGAIQPGSTWQRQFWLGLRHPFPGAPAPAATIALASDATSSGSVSALAATASVTVSLSGTMRAYSAATASATAAVALSSSAPSQSVLAATASATEALAGALLSESAMSAAPTQIGALAGAVAGVSALGATTAAAEALNGSVASAAALSAPLTATKALSGSTAAVAQLSGNLAPIGPTPLAGSIAAQSTLSLLGNVPLPLLGGIVSAASFAGELGLSLPPTQSSAMATPVLGPNSRSSASPIATPVLGPVATKR